MLDRLRKLLENEFSPQELAEKLAVVEADLHVPAKIIGIGQTGVGKTELLKSLFQISEESLASYRGFKAERAEDFYHLKTGATKSVTKDFFSFVIRNDEGFQVQFTDGPGLGECAGPLEEKYLRMWSEEIPRHDLLYWVLDGSSRDIAHIQENMKRILDLTGYRNRLVVVLNKIDQILLPHELEDNGVIGWDMEFNCPSLALESLIQQRVEDVVQKLSTHVLIDPSQIVACSARRRWEHGAVLDKILELLPEDVKIKASRNRQVKDFTELMSKRAQNATASGVMTGFSRSDRNGSSSGYSPCQGSQLGLATLESRGTFSLIGIGQTGVGKTELLRALFQLTDNNLKEYLTFRTQRRKNMSLLETGSVRSVTREFQAFQVETDRGLSVQFTDGPGLGESSGILEGTYFDAWVAAIQQSDVLYWVLDGSSRDIAHIQLNMRRILDATNYREKLVVVLNKIDQILLPIEDEIAGEIGWDPFTNAPSKRLRRLIDRRISDVIEKLSSFVHVTREQIVICSARRRWNLESVLDGILAALPK